MQVFRLLRSPCRKVFDVWLLLPMRSCQCTILAPCENMVSYVKIADHRGRQEDRNRDGSTWADTVEDTSAHTTTHTRTWALTRWPAQTHTTTNSGTAATDTDTTADADAGTGEDKDEDIGMDTSADTDTSADIDTTAGAESASDALYRRHTSSWTRRGCRVCPSQEADPDHGTWVVMEPAKVCACLKRGCLLFGAISTLETSRTAASSVEGYVKPQVLKLCQREGIFASGKHRRSLARFPVVGEREGREEGRRGCFFCAFVWCSKSDFFWPQLLHDFSLHFSLSKKTFFEPSQGAPKLKVKLQAKS